MWVCIMPFTYVTVFVKRLRSNRNISAYPIGKGTLYQEVEHGKGIYG